LRGAIPPGNWLEGHLKYREKAEKYHAICVSDTRYSCCVSASCPNRSFLPNSALHWLQPSDSRYYSWFRRANLLRPLTFFMQQRAEDRKQRREEERRLSALPQIVVRQLPKILEKEIQVSLPNGAIARTRGVFVACSLGNDGERRTTHIVPHVVTTELSQYALPLDVIWAGESKEFHVRWNGTLDEFNGDNDRFATALVRDKNLRMENPTLEGKGFLLPFLLFFTVEDSEKLYISTQVQTALTSMPRKFLMELHVTATGIPRKLLTTYEVDANGWHKITIRTHPVE
jgi:hypothetical protein